MDIAEQSFMPEFPERPGALRKFLQGIHAGSGWNISLFHYRNHGGGSFNDSLGVCSLLTES